jgi:hypothetical protein
MPPTPKHPPSPAMTLGKYAGRSESATTGVVRCRNSARAGSYEGDAGSFKMIPNRPFLLKRLRSGRIGSASQIMD